MLSHPILADAIENEFVAAAVYNSVRAGDASSDARALARFAEPAWNNPVVRYVDAAGRDLVPRRDGVYAPGAVAARMIEALEAARKSVPAYLRLAAIEFGDHPRSRATFEMHCFWEGEARLGAIDGVLATRPGFIGGTPSVEVVEVEFDARVVSFGALVAEAKRQGCARTAYAHDPKDASGTSDARLLSPERARDAAESDRKRSLSLSPLRLLPLTEAQSCRVNAALARGASPADFLSPRQRRLAERLLAATPEEIARLAGAAAVGGTESLPLAERWHRLESGLR